MNMSSREKDVFGRKSLSSSIATIKSQRNSYSNQTQIPDYSQNRNSKNKISELIEKEISSFANFSKSIIKRNPENIEMKEAFETINQLGNDSHLFLEDKIPPFFAAIRSFVISSMTDKTALKVDDLNTMVDYSSDNQLQEQIFQLKRQIKKLQKNNTFLMNQIISEHEQIADFTKQFDPSAFKLINESSFIEREIGILSNTINIDYAEFRLLIERNFGQIRPNRLTFPELLDFAFSKMQEVDDFIQKMRIALEIESSDDDFDTLLNGLQDRLSIIPKVQSSLSQIESEKEALQQHCDELEKMIKKQSSDFNKSHKLVVDKLQNRIKELQQRNNNHKLEEMAKVLMDTEEIRTSDAYVFSLLQKKYEEISKTYQECLQKLIDQQNLTRDLKFQLNQKDQQIKDLKEDLNNRLNESITELENEHKSGIEELTKMQQRSFEELSHVKKKAQKYQSQLRDSEMSIRDLETKVDSLSGITEDQTSKINALSTKLKKKKIALAKISKEYSEFQQTHLQVVSKLATAQSEVKSLKKQNEFLSKELSESKESIDYFEKETCSKSELDKCYQELQDKEKSIDEMKKTITKQTSLLNSFEQRHSILEEYKNRYAEEHESLNKQQAIVSNLLKQVKVVHSFFISHVQTNTNSTPFFIELLKLIQPLFDLFSLPTYSFDYVRPLSLHFVSTRIANFRPNSETDIISTEDKVILKRIEEEISDFPKDESNYLLQHHSLLTITDNLSFILNSIIYIKRMFNERNESLNTLTNLVKNQQSAILRMTHTPSSPK